MRVIEVLCPEFSNMYADLYNITYLSKCSKEIKVIYTSYGDRPYFMDNHVDMVYMGAVSDLKIPIIIDYLKEYKKKIKSLIEDNIIFFITGNSLEVFGKEIEESGSSYKALGLLDYRIIKDMNNKHTSWFLGDFDDNYVIGYRGQYSICTVKDNLSFIKRIGGYGSDLKSDNEGIHYKNFFATYLIGPFLIMNPYFTKFLLKKLGLKDDLIYEKEIMDAYNFRKDYFLKDGVRFDVGDHG